ncbi:alpha/beta fold hydrolase [Flavobacterium sp. Fl-318]|uniref:Alpha/beta fold hydrolase n=2 Tax=Flavobacterium TaxID=237 RepID=A0ABU4R8V2_9FLAO|nr:MULTISPECIES: alpha/beta fold hydrolase [unclassified Flavobacterium]MDX6188681.1 alpha/beta fold hydrolase [Flavobacterium sp. Fl-318]UFH44531.1 alpha/beta fold hydrolase [Flavobacterium sp. F-323]
MKKLLLLLLAFSSITTVFAQDITGQWNGILKVQGTQLTVIFNVNKNENGFSSTMDSPDQKAIGIPTTSTSYENSTLKIALANFRIEYEGVLGKDNTITGIFKQGGQSFPLNLSKEKIEKEKLVRPQEPVKPFPYYSEDVVFENKSAGINLAGTLTLPKKEGVFPAVILISGSGPQNRDEELLGHKPFLVLSDYLTKNGIAVLRFDDRGTAASKGDFKTGTSLDFSTDVEAGVQFLLSRKEINKKKIGLVGHSEGGLIAPILASKSKDIAFIVLMAGPGLQGDQLLLLQQKLIAKAGGAFDSDIERTKIINQKTFEIVNKYKDPQELKTQLTTYLTEVSQNNPDKPGSMTLEDYVNLRVAQVTNPWMAYFLRYNPEPVLEKVKCPVLALNGEKDLQVAPKENLEIIQKALAKGGNKKVTIKEIPNLNHLFQECQTGSPDEYSKIEQTLSPIAMNEVLQWIKVQTK